MFGLIVCLKDPDGRHPRRGWPVIIFSIPPKNRLWGLGGGASIFFVGDCCNPWLGHSWIAGVRTSQTRSADKMMPGFVYPVYWEGLLVPFSYPLSVCLTVTPCGVCEAPSSSRVPCPCHRQRFLLVPKPGTSCFWWTSCRLPSPLMAQSGLLHISSRLKWPACFCRSDPPRRLLLSRNESVNQKAKEVKKTTGEEGDKCLEKVQGLCFRLKLGVSWVSEMWLTLSKITF